MKKHKKIQYSIGSGFIILGVIIITAGSSFWGLLMGIVGGLILSSLKKHKKIQYSIGSGFIILGVIIITAGSSFWGLLMGIVGGLILSSFWEVKATIKDVYEGGLPDVKAPKKMTLKFYEDKVKISYGYYGLEKIIIEPKDILELDFGTQKTDTTAKTIKGALVGGVLAGGIGALAMAHQSSKRKREDYLHLVINYKGQARAIHFQNDKNAQKMYNEFRKLQKIKL